MIRFQIPRPFISGFETLLKIGNEQVDEISGFLNSIPVGTGPQTFGRLLHDRFSKAEYFNTGLATTLYSLGSFVQTVKNETVPENELISGLAYSFKEQAASDLHDDEIRKLEHYLLTILTAIEPLRITFKAFQLLGENERVVRDGHIVTDIRILFNEKIEDSSRHGIIKHQLKLQVEENDEQKDYFFSLSSADLQKLKVQIDRALKKENLIRTDYNERIAFINVTD